MNAAPQPPQDQPTRPQREEPSHAPQSHRAGRILLQLFAWTFYVILLLIGCLAWYANSASFKKSVRNAVVAELEKSTGGRVDLQRFDWRLTHLEFEADNLTIHGLEAPGQVPYAHIDRLFVRLQILSFFRTKIGLNYLEADHPVVHLIVYPDGSTNQPKPKHPASSDTKNQIFSLGVGRTVLDNGVAILNDRKIPFNLSANNLAAQVSYVPSRDHYTGTLHAEDIVTQRGTDTPVHSVLDVTLDVGRDTANLLSLTLQSGPSGKAQKTVVRISGGLNNFSSPTWQFTVKGAVDALEVRALTGLPGLEAGTAQLDATGHGANAQFLIDGTARLSGAAYRTGTVHVTNLTADAVAHVTQDQIAVTNIHARLATGGALTGDMRIVNWNTPAPAQPGQPAPSTAPEKGAIHTRLAGFTLDSILSASVPPRYRHLGFDTSASGTANVAWTGSVSNLTGAVDVQLTPPHPPSPNEVPVTGTVNAEYVNRSGTVVIHDFDIQTPASQIQIAGSLGVYPMTRASALNASLSTRDLSEFNPALTAFGLAAHGQGSPVPAQLRGVADFHGTVSGNLKYPDFRGHLQATNFNLAQSATPAAAPGLSSLQFNSLTADATYTAGSLSVSAATLIQGKTTIQFSGEVRGRRESPKDLFADSSAVRATLQVSHADLSQWIAFTGKNFPVSGTLDLHAQTGGTIGDLDGTGYLILAGGSVEGEPYHLVTTDIAFEGNTVNASHLVFTLDGGSVRGSAGYNLASKGISLNLQGAGFELSHIRKLQNAQYPVSGSFSFQARGSGTLQNPSLQASAHIRNLHAAREFTGFVDLDAHTQDHALLARVTAHLNTSTLDLRSQTQLTGDYQTRASLDIARFNIDPLLRTFSVSGIQGSSSIAGTVTVSGPLKEPKQLSGDLRLSEFSLTLEGVPIRSDGPLHASLRNGVFTMDPLHITGQDTDLRTQGFIDIFAKPRTIHGKASGSVNMALAQTLDTDIISSGHVDFSLNAEGTTVNPDLTGQVRFTNVNVALEDYVNGLSRMNGQLVFDQDRLDFKDVTAYSGGGLIRLGGFVTYHRGLYADLTADAKDVHIRYPEGITSTASAQLRFQGSQASMILSGHVLLTGFSVSPTVDLASLASATNGVSLPPNPNSPSNRVRLDVHITSAPSLNFQNSFARLAGNVDLAIRGTLAQPTVLGRVTITEGTATFNGEKFELQHGEVYFSNPVRIQPVVDITATTNVEDYTITISLQGNSSKLSPTFRSEPPLSEQDIFSLLAMGRTQEEQQIYSTEQQQAGVNSTADALLGGALNATISNRIQKLFGGGSVRIDPTFVSGIGNATARITIQEPISKKATLTYATNVNSTAEQLIQGEWRLTPDFSVLAVRDESGVFSLIFRLRRRYR
ncbi:MAG TPA: translocation/assembly module TamB domain-containing protein [Acidobacteriaceae bacterium]|jgi:translocation and assembly module TamB|nr:translocation/assembly module TamB domain-containing protein [Acidobacteriaceae bacterium]